MRRPVYFQYEMNSSESISEMVDSLLQDWSQIVHLYCLIEDMAEYLKSGNFACIYTYIILVYRSCYAVMVGTKLGATLNLTIFFGGGGGVKKSR